MTTINEQPAADWHRNEFMGLHVANQRAAHQILDSPKILEDPLALRIIGTEAESRLRSGLAQFRKPIQGALRAGVIVRNRFAEDELARSVEKGVHQYVILGAGLDTFAYRNPFPSLRVFEVDHPVTQVWKRGCLERAAIPIPPSVTYVSLDLEQQSLSDALRQSAFNSGELSFISFIGVVRYLSRRALTSVLTFVASSMRRGSEIVFDFGPPPSLLQVFRERARPGRTEFLFGCSRPSLQQRLRELACRTIANRRLKNDDFRPAYFEVDSFIQDLKRIGFADVQDFGTKEMNVRYCKDRKDGLQIGNESGFRMHLIKARV